MSKRPRTPATTKPESNPLLAALNHINLVCKEQGSIPEVHSLIYNKQITAHNGTIGAGHSVPEEIFAAPNNHLMLQALTKCGEHISITQLDSNRLAIKSGKFKAIVPGIDPNIIWSIAHTPDEPKHEITDSFREALETVGVLASDTADHIVAASIHMAEGTLIASDTKVIFEYWHGLQLPHGAALPKAIVTPLAKVNKKLVKFGYSNASVTFWFEDDSWLKTQIHAKHWPDVSHLLNKKSNPCPVPADFWQALAAVAPFSPTGAVYFGAGVLSSHAETGVGATFDVPGLPKGPIFSAKLLELIKPHAKTVDFLVDGGRMLMFYGAKVRGLVAGLGQ